MKDKKRDKRKPRKPDLKVRKTTLKAAEILEERIAPGIAPAPYTGISKPTCACPILDTGGL